MLLLLLVYLYLLLLLISVCIEIIFVIIIIIIIINIIIIIKSVTNETRTCTWKRGHGRHWYVRKKPSGVDLWDHVNACILLFLFIIQTLKFFTLFIFHYFLFILMFPFYLQATSAFYKPITIFFCIIKGDGITSRMEGYFSVSLFSILLYHTGL